MNKLDHCYLEALSEALKGNLGEALELRNEADALASEGFSFSENYGNKYPFIEEAVNTLLGSFDFTRCVRADGSAYGTRGKCKKGTEEAKQPVEKKATAQKSGRKVTSPSMVKAGREYSTEERLAMLEQVQNSKWAHMVVPARNPKFRLKQSWPPPSIGPDESEEKLPKVTNEERNIRRAMDRRSLALMKQISKELNKDEGSLEVLKELSKRQKTDEKFTALRSRAVEIVKGLRAQQKKKTDL